MDQALRTRDAEERVGHKEAVEEDIVAAHIFLAEHHIFDAPTGRKESVVGNIAADHTERGQVHLALGMEQLSTVLHSQQDGQVARASHQGRKICWYFPPNLPSFRDRTQKWESGSVGQPPQSCC
jgi:hypothetical protein